MVPRGYCACGIPLACWAPFVPGRPIVDGKTGVLRLAYVVLLSVLAPAPASAAFVSTGADGPLLVLNDTSLNASRYDFTDMFIGTGATLSFNPSQGSIDLYLLATGNVVINGNIYAPGFNLYISTPGALTVNGSLRSRDMNLTAASISSSASGRIDGSGTVTLTTNIDPTGTAGSPSGSCGANPGSILLPGTGTPGSTDGCALVIGNSGAGLIIVSGGSVSIAPIPLPGSALLFLVALPFLAAFHRKTNLLHGTSSNPLRAYQSA